MFVLLSVDGMSYKSEFIVVLLLPPPAGFMTLAAMTAGLPAFDGEPAGSATATTPLAADIG
jgi:hypothetical protein